MLAAHEPARKGTIVDLLTAIRQKVLTMCAHLPSNRPLIEVRGFKWPRRPTATTVARLLGEDRYGRWVGVAGGDPWWTADRSRSGVFEAPLVKVVPSGTFWTACFQPVVDVDIVLPVRWMDDVLEKVDLELDVLRLADGSVHVRDRDVFDQVQTTWDMPSSVAAQAQATCARVRAWVVQGAEPFGTVGQQWLAWFIVETDGAPSLSSWAASTRRAKRAERFPRQTICACCSPCGE